MSSILSASSKHKNLENTGRKGEIKNISIEFVIKFKLYFITYDDPSKLSILSYTSIIKT